VILPHDPTKVRVFCKGAPETVLSLCSTYSDMNGEKKKVTQEMKDYILQKVVKENSSQGLLSIMFAYQDIDRVELDRMSEGQRVDRDSLESQLHFLAVFLLEDPIRPSIREAIKDC